MLRNGFVAATPVVLGIVLAAAGAPHASASPRAALVRPAMHARGTPQTCTVTSGNAFVGLQNQGNVAGSLGAAVLGGVQNEACGLFGGIAAGTGNANGGSASFIGAGTENGVTSQDSFVGAGQFNEATGKGAFVGGGGTTFFLDQNEVLTTYGNVASGQDSFVGSGDLNQASGPGSFAGGGGYEYLQADPTATQGGNSAAGADAFVGAGDRNSAGAPGAFIGAGGWSSAKSGAPGNAVTSAATDSFLGAGDGNTISAAFGFLGGGESNTVDGLSAAVGGGYGNIAQGSLATVPGGYRNLARGTTSFAAGYGAQALGNGTFVWSDYSVGAPHVVASTANQFVARASGGVEFFSNAGSTSGVVLGAGSGAWASLSDRAMKERVVPLDDAAVLAKIAALPVSEWSYSSERGVRHVGPMAQDFYAAFRVGADDRHITSIDEDGVALAAIKALNSENASLRARLAALERKVDALGGARGR